MYKKIRLVNQAPDFTTGQCNSADRHFYNGQLFKRSIQERNGKRLVVGCCIVNQPVKNDFLRVSSKCSFLTSA